MAVSSTADFSLQSLAGRTRRGGRFSFRIVSVRLYWREMACPFSVLLRHVHDHQRATTRRRLNIHEEIDAWHLFGPTAIDLRDIFVCAHQ